MPKSFNKRREHFHVPSLLVLINFFIVTVIYYLHGHLSQSFSSGEILRSLLSGISLILAIFSLFSGRESFTKLTYILSLLAIIFLFLG